jgi:alkylation response protein AidB-like acyl-CoA dehydrogenase
MAWVGPDPLEHLGGSAVTATTLDKVRALGPEIGERAEEIERARDVPLDLVEKLRAAGVFSRYVPRSHGGQEMWPIEAVKVIEELARADGSVGWIAAVGSEGPGFYAYLPPETYDKIFAGGPDVIHSGSIMPRGRAERDGNGYRFTGQWGFASGCTHADFVCLQSFLEPREEGRPPRTVFGIVPAREVTILDTWFVNGLKGTASRDLVADGLFVSEEWTGTFQEIPTVAHHPLDRRSLLARFGLEFAATALGIAQGALDDIITISANKIPLAGMQPRLGTDPVLQHMVGSLATDLHMARVLLHDVALSDQASVATGPPDNAAALIRRAKLARVGSVSAAVVDGCYVASGTTGLFESNPLGRRLRDVRATTQHFNLSVRMAFMPAGAAVLGEPLPGGM